jgi:hypothetical protein
LTTSVISQVSSFQVFDWTTRWQTAVMASIAVMRPSVRRAS